MGFGKREHDAIPYRAVGPVTKEEYQSREERYDKHLSSKFGYNPKGKPIEDKLLALRKYREAEYEKLKDSVYKRRGWNAAGIPTMKKVKELGIDFPDVVALLKREGVET
jgi:aldehyde:ferredoxin oxidoreductase